jgi:dephospho-CoA kinase
VIDADTLAREAVAPGTPGHAAIASRWGPSVVNDDGSIDRAALRRLVFADPAERAALNAIVHPEVEARRAALVARARDAGASVLVCDIPLLFETGMESRFDIVILVDAPESVRLERLTRDRGLSSAEARAMMDAQLPARDKRARAQLVIDNDGSRADLQREVDRVWKILSSRDPSVS